MATGDRKQRSASRSVPPLEAAEALVGRTLDDRYRIDAPLGIGGMGAVYRGTHLKLGSPVAIKLLLHQHASSPALRKRFEREAKSLAALAHPSVVAVTDYGVSGDVPYLVMELLEGEPLSRRLPDAPFAPSQVLELSQQLLRALSFVHEAGLVHRDLKPANVFMQRLPDGEVRVKLLDFGLAKYVAKEPAALEQHLTPAGEAVGTPAYMPPEQIGGGPPDARTDVYAMGVILFQMLSGRLPFQGEPLEQLKSHLLAPVPSLAEAHPTGKARSELDALLQRAMAKQPAARFQDAAEMLAALDAIPQPWILPKDADETEASGVLAVAPTMLDPMRTSDAAAKLQRGSTPQAADAAGAEAKPRASDAGTSGARAASSESIAQPDLRGSAPAARPPSTVSRVGRLIASTVLLLAAASAAALYAIERGQPRHSQSPTKKAPQKTAPADMANVAVAVLEPPTALQGTQAPEATGAGDAAVAGPAQDAAALPLPSAIAPEPAAARIDLPARPAQPHVPARNPWTRGTPKELRTIRKVIAKGGLGTDRGITLIRKYSHSNPEDPRGHLLLAQLYINRHWRSDAISQYALAVQADASARGAPQMLQDLLAMVTQGAASDEAAHLIYRVYAREAVPALDHAIAAAAHDTAAQKRLRALRQRIAG